MSNTLTMDASHKVKGGGGHVSSFLHHIARDVDDRQGVPRQHANVNVDRARTHLNRTVVNDGKGGFKKCESVDEMVAHLDRRLATVKKPPRDGAVILRPLVLQLDPKWYDEYMPNWRDGEWTEEHQRYADAMLQWAADTFGQENIVGASWHMDETSPQLQVVFTPVTSDGRLNQKEWFTGPSGLRAMHNDFRTYMQGVGYDVSMDRAERSRERLSSTEFARRADALKEAQADVADTEAALDAMVESLEVRKANVADREAKAKAYAVAAASDRQKAAEARARAEEAETAAEAERARLAAVPTPEPVELSRAEVLAELPAVFCDYRRDYPKVAEHFDAYVDRKYADKVRIAQRAHPLGEYHGPSRDGFANQTKKASDADRDRRTKAAPVVPPTAPGHSLFDGLG